MTDTLSYDPLVSETPDEPVLYATLPRRIQAIAVDSLLLAAVLVAGAIAGESLPAGVARAVNIASLLALVLYEPLMVWRYGSTLGHRALNLRVVADEGGSLPLWRALLRGIVKPLLGFISLLFVAVTSRRQALHDMLARCTVQPRDAAAASAAHFTVERQEPAPALDASAVPLSAGQVPQAVPYAAHAPEPVAPHWGHRLAVTLGYCLLISLLFASGVGVPVTHACLDGGPCTAGEQNVLGAVGFVWIAALGALALAGWQGMLPGARRLAVRTGEDGSPLVYVRPHWARRAVVVAAWWVVAYFGFVVVAVLSVSQKCIKADRCSEGEFDLLALVLLLTMIVAGAIALAGWKGRLLGARRHVLAIAGPDVPGTAQELIAGEEEGPPPPAW
jgi:uncharacterized RDD family membrane protein YckC